LGQNRKSGDAIATSDLPLKADIKRKSRHVRKVPWRDINRRADQRKAASRRPLASAPQL